ncbi:hypothetical protein OUZ56_021605 [Daphnia magna]|uniref:Uncharacterized protein n=1 Tax=Daphnia magna TaxID=35525 RepID=A0ABR0AU62_9CRUS|nr:hypothetical protein OUZ56_021605 [Daphnia magna]
MMMGLYLPILGIRPYCKFSGINPGQVMRVRVSPFDKRHSRDRPRAIPVSMRPQIVDLRAFQTLGRTFFSETDFREYQSEILRAGPHEPRSADFFPLLIRYQFNR